MPGARFKLAMLRSRSEHLVPPVFNRTPTPHWRKRMQDLKSPRRAHLLAGLGLLAAASLAAAGCSSSKPTSSASSTTSAGSGTTAPSVSVPSGTLNGSGSTFQLNFDQDAIAAFDQAHSGVTINYGGGGSGKGQTDL